MKKVIVVLVAVFSMISANCFAGSVTASDVRKFLGQDYEKQEAISLPKNEVKEPPRETIIEEDIPVLDIPDIKIDISDDVGKIKKSASTKPKNNAQPVVQKTPVQKKAVPKTAPAQVVIKKDPTVGKDIAELKNDFVELEQKWLQFAKAMKDYPTASALNSIKEDVEEYSKIFEDKLPDFNTIPNLEARLVKIEKLPTAGENQDKINLIPGLKRRLDDAENALIELKKQDKESRESAFHIGRGVYLIFFISIAIIFSFAIAYRIVASTKHNYADPEEEEAKKNWKFWNEEQKLRYKAKRALQKTSLPKKTGGPGFDDAPPFSIKSEDETPADESQPGNIVRKLFPGSQKNA